MKLTFFVSQASANFCDGPLAVASSAFMITFSQHTHLDKACRKHGVDIFLSSRTTGSNMLRGEVACAECSGLVMTSCSTRRAVIDGQLLNSST